MPISTANGDDRSRRQAIAIQSSRLLLYMKKSEQSIHALEEPVGIVISRGSRHEHVPTVAAYVWGPPPEVSEEVRESKVA